MHIPHTRRLVAALTLTAAALVATGCGSSSLDSGSGSSSSAAASSSASGSTAAVTLDQALAAKVPADIKSKGTLADGTDGSYAPNEFIGADGKTMEGMDVDLLNAIATTLGLKVTYNNASFDTIILGVTSGKYDIAISSFTINDKRKQVVNMVQYFNAGTSWAAKAGTQLDPNNACGKTISVQKGTVQVDDLTARSKKCTDAGNKPITQVVETDQSKAAADVISGKSDGMLADSPVTAYAIQQSNGQLVSVGSIYDAAPYGIVVDKKQTAFAQVLSDALAHLKSTGVYDQILAKWGNKAGAVSSFPVNP
ncbi:MAG TPA: ABC transporter substrate-binding protein [Propionibacteriaceae bacterium]|nr:ABC transporter substrate-binding protein [Propionibacteriaceae bacterium]